jgi:hypothetical protein
MVDAAGFGVRVRVAGELDPAWWADVFEGLRVRRQADGTTELAGRLADDGAVHGLLAAVRDLGLALVALEVVPLGRPTA